MISKNLLPYGFIISSSFLFFSCGESEDGANFVLGGSTGSSNANGKLSIGITDAPVDDANSVVIEVDRITLSRSGRDNIVIDKFTSSDLNINDAETFSINLLQYQEGNQAIVVSDFELAAGNYSDMVLTILDDNSNQSYVEEKTGSRRALKIPSNTLSLGAFSIEGNESQTWTIDINLRQSLTYQSSNTEYRLIAQGLRLQNNQGDRSISGSVDSALFDNASPCDQKQEPTAGNSVYLYLGTNLNRSNLADSFDRDNSNATVPANAIAPYAIAAVKQNGNQWRYSFNFLPPQQYTLVFSCNAGDDDPQNYDDIALPLPAEQVIEVNTQSSGVTCNLPINNGECS